MQQSQKIKSLLITLSVIFIFISPLLVMADEFIVADFKHDPANLAARIDKRLYDNDEACALILIRTSITNLSFLANTGVVGNVDFKDGYYWLYLSPGTRRISFYKEGFERFNYDIPERINSLDVYILTLRYKRTDINSAINTMGFVVINSEPSAADVYIDGEATGLQTPFSKAFNEGYYRFSLKKNLYHEYSGDYIINPKETTELKIDLKPNYGKLNINTTPEQGAEIIIDGRTLSQNTPAIIDFLSSEKHILSVRLNMYETYQQEFNINDGETSQVAIDLKPTFGIMQIKAGKDDEIYLDKIKIAAENFNGRVSKGTHLLEVKKSGYSTDSRSITVEAGQTVKYDINLKAKTGVLSVNSSPLKAEIYLNNELHGETPKFINNLRVGTYNLKLQKQGYATVEKQIKITEDQTLTLNEKLTNAQNVQISSNPNGAKLYVDGQYKGITPLTLSLSFESHNFKLEMEGYKDLQVDRTVLIASSKQSFRMDEINPQEFGKSALVKTARIIDNKYYVDYTLSSVKYYQTQEAYLFVSADEGKTFKGPLKQVQGDISYITKAGNHTITWDFLKEMPLNDKKLIFEVRTQVKEEARKRKLYLSYVGNISSPIGLRLGFISKIGFYIEGRMSLPPSDPISYNYNGQLYDYDKNGYYEFSGASQIEAKTVLLGISTQISRNAFLYFAAGYGIDYYKLEINEFNYDTNSSVGSSWVKDETQSYSGAELDAGIMLRFGSIVLSAGSNIINFEYPNFTVGIGFSL
jgi:hypothetical protein